MKIYKNIPNFITLLNLTMGLIAIYLTLKGEDKELALAGYFIFIAAVFDFFDGFAARMLNAKSDIGLQLDSLADMISFGAAPGFILYKLILLSNGNYEYYNTDFKLIYLIALLVPWGAALRLAKFNIDETQQTGFKGLPTPALAFFIASLSVIREVLNSESSLYNFFSNIYFLVSVAIIGFFLMTSSFPMFALKFKGFGWKTNEIKYTFLIISLLLLLAFNIVAIPFIIIIYILISMIVHFLEKKR